MNTGAISNIHTVIYICSFRNWQQKSSSFLAFRVAIGFVSKAVTPSTRRLQDTISFALQGHQGKKHRNAEDSWIFLSSASLHLCVSCIGNPVYHEQDPSSWNQVQQTSHIILYSNFIKHIWCSSQQFQTKLFTYKCCTSVVLNTILVIDESFGTDFYSTEQGILPFLKAGMF